MSVANTEVLIFNSELLKERDYWTGRLLGVNAAAGLPTDYDGLKDHSRAGSVFEFRFADSVFRDLLKLTGDSAFLKYTALLAAAKICLHKYTGRQTILVGSPALKELDRPNLLAIVSELDDETSFRQFLLGLQDTLLDAYAHQSYPYNYLIRDLNLEIAADRPHFFELVVMVEELHGDLPDLGSDLTLKFENLAERISGSIQFNPDRYSRETVAVFANHLAAVVAEALGNTEKRLADFKMLTAGERQRVLSEWNQTERLYTPPCLHQIFETQVERFPHAVALRAGETRLTYAELNARANQLAHGLSQQGVGPEVPVGICLERSVEMVVAVLGVLKAGGAFVPLDPAYPLERLQYVIEEINPPVVLTQAPVAERLPAHWGQVVCLDEESARFSSFPKTNPDSQVQPENPAYVIYTSGSTGRPKGVIVPHTGLGNVAASQSGILGIQPNGRVLQFASLSFDAAMFDLMMAWGSAGEVCLIPQNSLPLGRDLRQLLIDYGVTTVTLPPTALATLPDDEFPDLSTITVAGEACSTALVERFSPGRRFFNLYGPTEATIWSTATECVAGNGKPLIGKPIDNVTAYILDERMEPLPIGVAGELYVGGIGLARGYWGLPDLTAEKFVPHPFSTAAGARLYRTGDLARFRADGQIDFLGRLDHQVKLRGFRIELGEIEAVLKQHAAIQDALVIVREDNPDDRRIVAYFVPREQRPPTAGDLISFLRQKLPEHMMPQAFVAIEQVPLTPNGKVDRRRLMAPDTGRPDLEEAFVEPSGEAEQTLARIWSAVLRVERVGSHDNFFALGGDSILAMQVAARADEAGLRLLPRHMFQHQTIAELALVAGTAVPIQAEQGIVTGAVPLTPVQSWFFEQNLPEAHHYNQAVMLEVQEKLDLSSWKELVQHLLRQHDALRMRYRQEETGWQQFNAGIDEGIPFEYFDLSALPENQQTAFIEQQAKALQASLSLANGPLLRVALFDPGLSQPARLLVAIHHLVVDGVSFRIILEHLQTGYGQARRGEPLDFGKKTTSFKYWAESLREYARSAALEAEQPYWLEMARAETAALPVDYRDGANTIESARRVQVSLGTDETRALLQEVPAAYRTQINDVLLTSVAQAFQAWTGERNLLISLEGHGREEINEDLDVSRTVGWFTSEFPMLLTLAAAGSEFQALPMVKEQLRSIPQKGIGYGLLRYLGDERVGEQLRQMPRPEVSFNYLGQFDQVLDRSGPFGIARESKGRTQSERGHLPCLIQINGSIIAGSLQLTWSYSENVFSRTTIERLAEGFLTSLKALIAHCQSPDAGGFTPSDFPLAHLSQAQLDQVIGPNRQIEDLYPLSPFQQGLLFHTLFTPEVDVYFTQLGGTIEQQLDAGAFKRALQRVIDRHPILRTAFVWEGVSEPLQVVHKQVELPWQEFDWRTLNVSQQETELEAFLTADRQRDFVFSEAPIMRCTLVRLGEDSYRFIWSFHHLLLDGWALFQVAKEAFAFYDAFVEGRELSVATTRPFRDYIGWLQRQDRSRAERFWREALKGFAAPTPLVMERAADEHAELEENYHDQRLKLSAETTEALQSLARKHQLTLNTIVQGVYGLLLSRYCGEDDVVFGATVAGRPATLVGVESMIGIFINTLPARIRISPALGVLPWLKQLQEQQVEAQEYDHSPLAQVQGWSEVPRGQPLFESILVFENYPVDASLSQPRGSLSLKDVKSFDRANYPLTIGASPGRELLFRFSYDRRRFDDEAITRMFGHLEAMLEAIVAHPEMRVADVPLLTGGEQQQVLVDWNQTAAEFPGEHCLHQLFEAQVERCSQAVAVYAHDQQLSYAELNERANRVAHFLREQGVGPDVLVGVCLERSLEMVVALLAVLKAGGAYVPLDPAYPLERLRYMMEEINAWVVLTQASVAERLPAHWGQVVCMDDESESFASFPAANPNVEVSSDNLANLIFTSGSLGAPKATMVTHRGLRNTILSRVAALSLTASDRILQTTSFSFDASVWEFFAPLAIGARLIMLQPGQHQRPAEIVAMLAEHQVTTVQLPPSWLQMVLQERGLVECQRLAHVVCGGEIITADLQKQFFATVDANLHNLYGPTETSIDATSWTCDRAGAKRTVPIGKPIANVQVYLLDSHLRPVPVGVKGELHIGGVGLARGYLNQPHTTAEKFIPNPFAETPGSRLYKTGDVARYLADGNIEFCGRNDDQVKIRGFRIEPGEIESVLVQHEKVREAVVIARADDL
ncbi:MAG TPA: amino acid adenylation domain-containing protein, partial [Pyrinomonadaceae bacterium]|nr:amino acid adenylation domain-containing protein [Pyrinomonadaceae bacterium]